MQTEQEKQEVIMKFVNEVQPKVFPLLASTDHNVNYFKAILDSNWSANITIELLEGAINHFREKFEWLAEPSAKPVLTPKERRALVGLPESDWHPERWDDKQAREAREAVEKRRQFESEPKNIEKAKQECEELARSAAIGSHSDNSAFRQLLSDTWVQVDTPVGKKVDYFKTLTLRKELYDKAVKNKSVSTHALRAW